MRVLLFGATGMIGQSAWLECQASSVVGEVVSVVRRPTGVVDTKLKEIVHGDFHNFDAIADSFANIDACFFCLGIASSGMTEDAYRRVTVDIARAAATTLFAQSPNAMVVFISGQGTDSTEKGRVMWARVKGEAENALLAMSPRTVMFRPGFIQPMKGVVSATTLYRVMYKIMRPVFPLIHALGGDSVMTSEDLGRAMLVAAQSLPSKRVLEAKDINALVKDR